MRAGAVLRPRSGSTNFNSAFRKAVGTTPSFYRARKFG